MSLQGKKVLVVDDEEGIRDLVVSELEFNGALCQQAANGAEAFKLYQSEIPDAVVSDIRMPNGDGLFFLEEIKKADLYQCPMIFMTGYSDVPVEEFYDRGVEVVISKPFRLDQIVSALGMAISARRSGWRRSPRLVSAMKVMVTVPDREEPLVSMTFTVGRGGLFVQSSVYSPALNTQTRFKLFYVADGVEQTIEGDIIVRWVRAKMVEGMPAGFGCQFVNLTEEQMDLIGALAGLAKLRPFIPKA